MSRVDRREPNFDDDEDRRLFLAKLGEACEKTDWQVHAWYLMSNHFHLVSETRRGNLVQWMQWFLGVYTNRFNHRHKKFGHLFSGRYKALPWMVERLRMWAARHVACLLQRYRQRGGSSEDTWF